ncbi:cereblon family protein [Desulfomarina sp.]
MRTKETVKSWGVCEQLRLDASVGDKGETEERKEKALFCRPCGYGITGKREAIEVNGAHEHTFFNPAGVVFHLGCFRIAPGCVQAGPATSEFTWFKGYIWRFALCGNCGVHLGWQYQQDESRFFGLILALLRE